MKKVFGWILLIILFGILFIPYAIVYGLLDVIIVLVVCGIWILLALLAVWLIS